MKSGAFHDLSETSKKCQWAEQFPLERRNQGGSQQIKEVV